MTITLTGRPKIEVTESCGKLDLKGEMMLWTYLDLQGKPHLLVLELIPPVTICPSDLPLPIFFLSLLLSHLLLLTPSDYLPTLP
jgi:hypothetical protein